MIQLKRIGTNGGNFEIQPGQLVLEYSNNEYLPRVKVGGFQNSKPYSTAMYLCPDPLVYMDNGINCGSSFTINDLPISNFYTTNNKPTKSDVGLSEVNNVFCAGYMSPNTNTHDIGYVCNNNVRCMFQKYMLTNSGTGTQLGTSGIYVKEIEVNWEFEWNFLYAPIVLLQPSGINYRLIQVKACNITKDGIGSVQIYTYTDDFPAGSTIFCIAIGEVPYYS